jgi:hypothetical protein
MSWSWNSLAAWRSLARWSAQPGKNVQPHRPIRPALEVLERRETPSAATAMMVTGLTQQYNLSSQTETITAQVRAGGEGVKTGQITFTDAGHIQTVKVDSNGMATATFRFGLLQEQPKAHSISVAYSGAADLAPSSASVTAPDTTQNYLLQLLLDFEALNAVNPQQAQSLLASTG